MKITESLLRKIINSLINEGRYDPSIYKAIFLAGAPGSGKSHIVKNVIMPNRHGLRVVNVDDVFEHLLTKQDLPFDTKDISPEVDRARTSAFFKAAAITSRRKKQYIESNLGIVIDGTGGSFGRIRAPRERLENMGYETFMVFIDTSYDEIVRRNDLRASKGGRRLKPEELRRSWNAVNSNKEKYVELFGDNIVIIDGNEMKPKELTTASKKIEQFLR